LKDSTIPGPAGPVPVRIHMPDTMKGVYLHFHWGGFVLGKPVLNDSHLDRLANNCDMALVSVDHWLRRRVFRICTNGSGTKKECNDGFQSTMKHGISLTHRFRISVGNQSPAGAPQGSGVFPFMGFARMRPPKGRYDCPILADSDPDPLQGFLSSSDSMLPARPLHRFSGPVVGQTLKNHGS
jgi:hypothetical protein